MLKQFFTKSAPACASLQLALLALFMLASPTAQAQAAPTEILLANKAGCKLFHPVGPGVIDAQLLNAAGHCVDGFFQGAVLYGVSWSIDITNRPSRQVAGVRAAVMQLGRFQGPRLHINRGGRMNLVSADGSTAYRADIAQAQFKLPDLLAAINTEKARAGGPYAGAINTHLTSIANIWNIQGDPKGFGRPARGG